MNVYKARLKTRKEMDATIPREDMGWWHDVCPGETLTLRDATAEDISRCHLKEHSSRDPADYFCEPSQHGALVNKVAVAEYRNLSA